MVNEAPRFKFTLASIENNFGMLTTQFRNAVHSESRKGVVMWVRPVVLFFVNHGGHKRVHGCAAQIVGSECPS